MWNSNNKVRITNNKQNKKKREAGVSYWYHFVCADQQQQQKSYPIKRYFILLLKICKPITVTVNMLHVLYVIYTVKRVYLFGIEYWTMKRESAR